jgi:hypothetical protein
MRIHNNLYVFLREGEYIIVSPTTVGEEKGSRDLGCVEGGSGEPVRDGGGILGELREAVGSRGEMVVGDAGEKQI